MAPPALHAQYFGRNKVQYEDFDFRIFETEHFRLHFYPVEEQPARDMARMAERWNTRLSSLFRHQLTARKPILIYANQPDFQQTNAVSGQLSEGTGGVTESLRDRLIMPLTGVYRDNDHVLGHEIVHLFQYDLAKSRTGGGEAGLGQLPLWVVEGVAEYLSLGRNDPHTAMWMRDAVLNNKLPTTKQLTNDSRFFPYRYGQALWAYVGGRFGDGAVTDTYRAAARYGFDAGIKRAIGITSDSLSKEWIAATRSAYSSVVQGRMRPSDAGQPLIPVRKAGESSLSPVISPDGRYVAYFASSGLFGIDLYLADAATGRSVKRLADISTSTEFDALSFISSAGAWSPDGQKFAFVVYAKGDQEIAILDVASQDVERRIRVPEVGAIQNPAWSPDGRSLAFSGSDGGVSDLFVFDLATRVVNRLTRDRYADIQPTWSPDGRTLAFATDRHSGTDFGTLTHGPLRLALLDVASAAIRPLPGFADAKHINPQYSPDGTELYFVSDRDGVSDIFRLTLASGSMSQVTRVATGVSGITNLSPAISVSPTTGRVVFSVFEKQGYGVYALSPEQSRGAPVNADSAGVSSAGLLPPADALATSIVGRYLANPTRGLPTTEFAITPYRSRLALAAVGQPSVGVSSGGGGTYVGGGTSFFFTDILGNRNVGVSLEATGTIADIGGQVFYQNLENRINWAVVAGHTPYLSGFVRSRPTVVDIGGQRVQADLIEQFLQRVFIDQVTLIGQYPLSPTRRFELNAGYTRLGFSTEVKQLVVAGNRILDESTRDTTSPPSVNYGQSAAAFVGDNSFSGFTAPIAGARYRFEFAPTFGALRFQTATADARRYFFARPVTFAVRGLHFGRYGADAESERLSPIFLGEGALVRGYSAESFDPAECTIGSSANDCPEFDRLVGSRIAVASIELRIPLLGTSDYGLIRSPLFPVDIAPFVDAGVAWTSDKSASLEFVRRTADRVPVFSAGISARANLLGFAVVEAYYARPFQRPDQNWILGFQLAPGW